jgi:hypothetical protein
VVRRMTSKRFFGAMLTSRYYKKVPTTVMMTPVVIRKTLHPVLWLITPAAM